jgi:hypothetical protein
MRGLFLTALCSSVAAAQTAAWDFETSEGFVAGSINDQPDSGAGAWRVASAAFDEAITDGGAHRGTQSFITAGWGCPCRPCRRCC